MTDGGDFGFNGNARLPATTISRHDAVEIGFGFFVSAERHVGWLAPLRVPTAYIIATFKVV